MFAVIGIGCLAWSDCLWQDVAIQQEAKSIRELLESGKLDDAQLAIDGLALKDEGASVAANLGSHLQQVCLRKIASWKQLADLSGCRVSVSQTDENSIRMLANTLIIANSICLRAEMPERSADLRERALTTISHKLPDSGFSPLYMTYTSILRNKATALASEGKRRQAIDCWQAMSCRRRICWRGKLRTPKLHPMLLAPIRTYCPLSKTKKRMRQCESYPSLAVAQMNDHPHIQVVTAYTQAMGAFVSRVSSDNPERAENALKKLRAFVEKAERELPEAEHNLSRSGSL